MQAMESQKLACTDGRSSTIPPSRKYVDEEKINRVGGPMHVCAVDESHVGKLGYMVGKQATSGGQSKRKKPRIKKRMPCQTKWHCGARHGKKKKHGTSKDTRKHSRWMWFWC